MKFLVLLVLFLFFLSISFNQVHASVSENQEYRLEKQTADIIPYKAPTVTSVPKQKVQKKSYAQGKNFIATTIDPAPFSLKLTSTSLDFDKSEATLPVIRTTTMTISSPTRFIILGSQDHQLQAGELILPNTTCDNGSCSESLASLWKSNLTYGAGFRCDSTDNLCSKDFQKGYYRHFSDRSQGDMPEALMAGTKGEKQTAHITYKIVTSATQQPGAYRNTIQYIAIPSF